MKNLRYPSLYQINTRVWITDIANKIGRTATLDDIPDNELDRLAEMGFDWIWFLSVWGTGEVAQKISRDNPEWRHDFENTLPDLQKRILQVQVCYHRLWKYILILVGTKL
jgi:hypothetical protein